MHQLPEVYAVDNGSGPRGLFIERVCNTNNFDQSLVVSIGEAMSSFTRISNSNDYYYDVVEIGTRLAMHAHVAGT